MSEMHYANAVCAAINMNQASYPSRAEEDAPAVVNIADVHDGATQVSVRELRAGMSVWDIWGNEYSLERVTHFKHGCRTYRSDGEVEWQDYRDAHDANERAFTVRLPA